MNKKIGIVNQKVIEIYSIIKLTYNNKRVSEGGTGSRHPLLGDVGVSTYLNFLD